MSSCFEFLYDYDLVKKCCICGIVKLKTDFYKKLDSKDGLDLRCIPCMKKNYLGNRHRVKQYFLNNRDRIKSYQLKNHDKIIARKKFSFLIDIKQILFSVYFVKQEVEPIKHCREISNLLSQKIFQVWIWILMENGLSTR